MNPHLTEMKDVLPDLSEECPIQESPNAFIPVAAPTIGELEITYVTAAIKSGWVSSIGKYIDNFEAEFARYIGVEHAIAVSSGTTALHLALHALNLDHDDEVILPDLTFAATAHAVLQVGAIPVLVDVESDTWCMDPSAVERALSPRTRAIMPVHLFGHPADMSMINAIASARNILVIEDAAEAHGSMIDGYKVGALGKAGAFSFYGNKLITTGEGGMLTTDDDNLALRLRFLKDHGMSKERRYFHTELAFNYRMTNLQAALGLAQLKQIETFIQKKRQILNWYCDGLKGVSGITLNAERSNCRNIYWMVSIVLGDSIELSRDKVCARLNAQGIDTRPFFVPMSELPHLSKYRKVSTSGEECPVSGWLSRRGLNLPSGCGLAREQVARVCNALIEAIK